MVKGRTGQHVRLYARGTILGFKRSKSNQYESTSLVQIEGVNTKEDVAWYCGKRMAYIYKSSGTHYAASAARSPTPTTTPASSAPSFRPTCRPNPWGARSGSSCTRAASKGLQGSFRPFLSGLHLWMKGGITIFEANGMHGLLII